MIPDLVRALPAAVLVGVVPGWFWAGCLGAAKDRAERLAYSVAFSIALVPTAALVLARILGAGVTPAITVASALLVLGMGLAVYRGFGAAKGHDEPISSPPVPLDTPALVPLIVASVLMLGALFGAVSGERGAPAIALSVLAGWIAYALASPRAGTPPGPPSRPRAEVAWCRGSSIFRAARGLLLPAVLLFVLLRSYPGPLRYDWPFPRGVDKYEHAVMASMMLAEGDTGSFMLYPPGFHVLAAGVSGLCGLEPLELFAVLAPALLLLPALACYALARRLWGREVGVAAALFCGLIAGGSYEHVSHARYPNLLGVFLLVLALAALVRLYASSSVREGLTLAILGSAVVFYHMVASLYEAALLAVVGLLFVPYLLLRDRSKALALISSLALLGLLSTLYAWDTYDLGRLVAGLLPGGPENTGRGGEAVAMAIGTKPTYDIGHLLATTSQPVVWLGVLGALLVVGELLARREGRVGLAQRLAYLTVLLWSALLFVGSRTSLSGFPDRFERDLGIPLALLAALAFVTVVRSLGARRRPAAFGVGLLAALLVAATVGVQAVQNLEQAAGPSPRLKDRPPPQEIVEAGGWLREKNEGGNIVATPYLAYVPSRGVLAMGGYTGMQSYDAARIRRGRDLPPFGAGPLWEALWVLHHPEGERTREILEKNDVRYVVFHKRYPTIDWRPFAHRADLYRVAFENESVVVFEPRF